MSAVSLAIVGEDEGHYVAVTTLVDGVAVTRVDWLDGVLDACRTWHGLLPGERWYKYNAKDALDVRPVEIEGVRIAPLGHIGGEPLKAEAGMWRRILLLLVHRHPRPQVVVLARDLDGYPGRLEGLEQVRTGLPWPFRVVVATPEPEIEAWHVAGFDPKDDQERKRLADLTNALSFNPTTESHRLTSHPNDVATDAKKVLAHLSADDPDREAECLADRERLAARGGTNGLAAFLREIDTHIVPLFGAAR